MILANFVRHVPFDKHVQVALTVDQVHGHRLPLVPAKQSKGRNSHWPAFRERHHDDLVVLGWNPVADKEHPHQVELDALEPAVLRQLYADAIAEVWDDEVHQDVLDRERTERAELFELAAVRREGDQR